jgi:Bacteriophage tail tube protein
MNIIKNMNLFIDGKSYAGKIDEFTPPKLTLKTEEHRAGGMDTSVDIDMGMEKMEAAFILSDYNPDTLKLFGLTDGSTVPLTARAAAQDDATGTVVPILIEMRGKCKEIDSGTWKAGDKAPTTYALSLSYYKHTVNGTVIHEIDVENMIRKINGVDQLEKIREAIGI